MLLVHPTTFMINTHKNSLLCYSHQVPLVYSYKNPGKFTNQFHNGFHLFHFLNFLVVGVNGLKLYFVHHQACFSCILRFIVRVPTKVELESCLTHILLRILFLSKLKNNALQECYRGRCFKNEGSLFPFEVTCQIYFRRKS